MCPWRWGWRWGSDSSRWRDRRGPRRWSRRRHRGGNFFFLLLDFRLGRGHRLVELLAFIAEQVGNAFGCGRFFRLIFILLQVDRGYDTQWKFEHRSGMLLGQVSIRRGAQPRNDLLPLKVNPSQFQRGFNKRVGNFQ